MANTPQAKKRIRRNATRQTINHSRISRIRTFIKAVENLRKDFPGANPRRGQERKETFGARLGLRARDPFASCKGA